jgi:UDP-N-acetylmuramate: L-alanyl-gamma-D-glutamyl-meso-diaminopimelate ligase
MNLLKHVRRIHLIGICGTAMASLAGMLKESGYHVRGSDQNVYPPMSTELEKLNIEVLSGYHEKNLDWGPDLVIIGNALSRGNPEIERVLDERLLYCSMPEAVKEFFLRGRECIVVAGTHGKTTTTSILSWVFECAGLKPNFLIGGVAQNFSRSYQFSGGPYFIIEGDEYDTAFFDKGPKFLHYLPQTVLLNNVEYDHADIYPDVEAVRLSFRRLINIIPRNGALIANHDDPVVEELTRGAFCEVRSFGLHAEGGHPYSSTPLRRNGLTASGICVLGSGTQFSVKSGDHLLFECSIRLFGDFNVLNTLGAITTALRYDIPTEKIREALGSFQSVRRRMEIRGIANGVTVIDDFAHHPTAIRQTLQGIRSRFPNARIWAVVEPRSATMRRNVFEGDLARSFSNADEVILAELFYPEKIKAEQRLSPQRVIEEILASGKSAQFIPDAHHIVKECVLLTRPGDIIVVFSNGSFDNIHEKLLNGLKEGRSLA